MRKTSSSNHWKLWNISTKLIESVFKNFLNISAKPCGNLVKILIEIFKNISDFVWNSWKNDSSSKQKFFKHKNWASIPNFFHFSSIIVKISRNIKQIMDMDARGRFKLSSFVTTFNSHVSKKLFSSIESYNFSRTKSLHVKLNEKRSKLKRSRLTRSDKLSFNGNLDTIHLLTR